MKYLSIILSFAFCNAWSQQQDVKIEAVKVSDNIYMLKGRGGNVGISFGNDGVLVIDNQFEDMVPKIKDAIKSLTDEDIRYVVNTHYHGDHTGGNRIFGEEKKTIIAHENVFKRMNNEQVSKFFNRTSPASPPEALPEITFDHFVKLHINDDVVNVMHFYNAHTDGDAVIYFKKDDVIHMGDLFVRYGFPFIDADAGGSLTGFIETLDKVLILINDRTKVIPGHGELATKKDVEKFRDNLADIKDRIAAEVNAGKDLSAVLAAKPLAMYESDWGNGFIKSKDFITLVFPEFTRK